ncbi:hypothetical protein M413DRAFT_154881 [Hebeloma cylindrosporum]|uniref:ABM domain-containing protein n=1 Tax=Hebeloma cylindrosporum TaxID=76867 RepID=A0A0C3BW70_HEBCY|nr:hypothetical protein M413DRAFT_154881 [Hebeloma cylindrosporum h7]
MPLVQILSFAASRALLSDSSLAKPFLEYLKKAEGCLNVIHGFQAEDSTRLMIFIFWKSSQDCDNLSKRDDYPLHIYELPTSLPSSLDIKKINFNKNPMRAFDAPVTDISIIKVKDDCPLEEVERTIASLKALVIRWKVENGLSDSAYPTYFAWGEVIGVPDTYGVSTGWDSVEGHVEVIKWIGENPENLVDISSIIEADIKHVTVARSCAAR